MASISKGVVVVMDDAILVVLRVVVQRAKSPVDAFAERASEKLR